MTYSHANVRGQRSVGSEDREETYGRTDERTNGQTDGGDYIISIANAVGNDTVTWLETKQA